MKTDPFEPITRERAAEILEISLGTLDAMVRDGDLPPPCRIGNARKVYWDPDIFFSTLRALLQGNGACVHESSLARGAPAEPDKQVPAPRLNATPVRNSSSDRAKARQEERIAKLNVRGARCTNA